MGHSEQRDDGTGKKCKRVQDRHRSLLEPKHISVKWMGNKRTRPLVVCRSYI